jgi:radical SAM superfamily enzyme YgiQ (UPF0313 family)
VACGLLSLFVGFETLSKDHLREQQKPHNLNRDYGAAIRRLPDLGVMVNGSFVFGMDDDDETVFERTVDLPPPVFVGEGDDLAAGAPAALVVRALLRAVREGRKEVRGLNYQPDI